MHSDNSYVQCFVSGTTQPFVCCDQLPGPVHVGLGHSDSDSGCVQVLRSFVSLSVHHFIFTAALDRTRWRGLRTFLPEVGELQGRKELSCLFSAVKGLKKPSEVSRW